MSMLEVEITRLDPETGEQKDIRTAVPHPRRKVRSWRVEDGRVYVILINRRCSWWTSTGKWMTGQCQGILSHANPIYVATMKMALCMMSPVTRWRFLPIPSSSISRTRRILRSLWLSQARDRLMRMMATGQHYTFKPGVHKFWEGTWTEKDFTGCTMVRTTTSLAMRLCMGICAPVEGKGGSCLWAWYADNGAHHACLAPAAASPESWFKQCPAPRGRRGHAHRRGHHYRFS
jgi:hypothetical protein